MMSDLGLSEIQWGWVLAAFTAGYAIFQLPGGILGDRFGPRRVILGTNSEHYRGPRPRDPVRSLLER